MKKYIKLSLSTFIALFAGFYAAYYILLSDNFLHISVASIIAHSQQMPMKAHLMVLGLIPIYIAVVIFGAAMLAIYYFGPFLKMLIKRSNKKSEALSASSSENS